LTSKLPSVTLYNKIRSHLDLFGKYSTPKCNGCFSFAC
jgi:hypothetical protein